MNVKKAAFIGALIVPHVLALAAVTYMDGFASADAVREMAQGDTCQHSTVQRSLSAGQPLTRYEVFVVWNGCRAPNTDGQADLHRWRERNGSEAAQALTAQRRAIS